jgi:hypothetical protein
MQNQLFRQVHERTETYKMSNEQEKLYHTDLMKRLKQDNLTAEELTEKR